MSETKKIRGITGTIFAIGLITTMIIATVLSTGATLQFMPQGEKGEKGDVGNTGPQGHKEYRVQKEIQELLDQQVQMDLQGQPEQQALLEQRDHKGRRD